MNIALIAHDNKKELMVQFCIAYCGILSGNNLCSTASTGRLISDATGLKVSSYMSRKQGGAQQIAARIAYNEIDLVIFFCDPRPATSTPFPSPPTSPPPRFSFSVSSAATLHGATS